MRNISILFVLLLITIQGLSEHVHFESDYRQNKTSNEKIKLKEKAIIVVRLNSEELNRLKAKVGEDNFYSATDDFNWYNSQLLIKMDSLNIAVKQTDKDSTIIETPNSVTTILKDSTFSIFNYFYFDGENIEKTDIFNLLDK